MAEKAQSVARRIESQAKKGRLNDKVAVIYRLQGGRHEDAVDHSTIVTAAGELQLNVDNRIEPQRSGKATVEINRDEALDLIRSLVGGTSEMVPAAKARFLPDALVGSVTLVLGDEKSTYYFEADEEICKHRGEKFSDEVRGVMERIREVESRFISGSRPDKRTTGKEAR